MRSRSLFWTFAGVFLLVVALATALQVAIVLGVLRPIQESSLRSAATTSLSLASTRIADLEGDDSREIMRALHESRPAGNDLLIAYLGEDGRLIPERPVPPGMIRGVRHLAEEAHIAGASLRPPRDRFDGGPPDRMGEGPPPDRRGDGPPLEPRDHKLVLVHTASVAHGTLLAVADAAVGSGDWTRSLLFLPLAVLAAAAAGLWLARMMVRRLGALETVAARVEAGDLGARVPLSGQDEIGRLESRFK